jgi:archaellum biogenesis protein FlaJ (TadC family)
MAERKRINSTARLESLIRWAAALICAGLLVLLLTLIRIHPLAFVAFAVIGCPLVLAGILLFLYSIVSHQPETGG